MPTSELESFLQDHLSTRWSPSVLPEGVTCDGVYLGDAAFAALEVVYLRGHAHTRIDDVRRTWRDRSARRATPVLVVHAYLEGGVGVADLVGLRDERPVRRHVALSQVERLVGEALDAVTTAEAEALLASLFTEQDDALVPGLRNEGLFAGYELDQRVPGRPDWDAAVARSQSLRGRRGIDLLRTLGWEATPHGSGSHLLREHGVQRAVAVLLEGDEVFDRRAVRFNASSPIEYGLALAQAQELTWVLAVQGDVVRLYAANPDVGVGRKGATATFTELSVRALADDRLGYLELLLSPAALRADGSVAEILKSSSDHATGLGARLRDRVYRDVVPRLAETIASRLHATDEAQLREAYHVTLVVLFRLLFVAYAEDRALLPYRLNTVYTRKALKTRARDYTAVMAEHGRVDHDPAATDLWHDLTHIWAAVSQGHREWGVPEYGGALFAAVDDRGRAIAGMQLTNAEIGPALVALLVDAGNDGTRGPVDFTALSVREFGTIYEGLLESSLSIAPSDLALDAQQNYVPARAGAEADVRAGQIYFHNASGARKATGSYFTKPFAVEHLIRTALDPAIDEHLARVGDTMDAGDEAAASAMFFDLRVADIAMGSGHFLLAAIDHIALRFSAFLVESPLPQVDAELTRLRETAFAGLEAVGVSALPEIDQATLLRRQVARRCIYGIDVNQIAVDLARLAVWIHTFVPGLPMSALDHGLVQGNSLTGIGTLDEALDVLTGSARGARGAAARAAGQISLFEEPMRAALDAAADVLGRVRRTAEATAAEVDEAEAAHAEALLLAEPARALLDAAVAGRLGMLDLPLLALSGAEAVMAAGRRADVSTRLRELEALHFPVTFPEVFQRAVPGFDVILGNPPWEEVTIESLDFWGMRFPGIKKLPSTTQAARLDELRSNRPDLEAEFQTQRRNVASLRACLLSGSYPGMGTGDPDLYKAFAWRFWRLISTAGRMGVILPRSAFLAKGSAPWRRAVVGCSRVEVVFAVNEREWLFTDVNPGWPIALVGVVKSGSRSTVRVVGPAASAVQFDAAVGGGGVELDSTAILASDVEACIPVVRDEADLRLFAQMLMHPALGSARDDFDVRPNTELHATNEGKRLFFTGQDSDTPVWNHLNVGHLQFLPTAGRFNSVQLSMVEEYLFERRSRTASRSDSPFRGMTRAWIQDPMTLATRTTRIAFRDVVHASNRRKVWISLIPRGAVLTNKAPYLVFARGDLAAQAYLLGMLSSIIVDWFGHLRMNLNLNFFIFNAIPIPKLDLKDPCSARVGELAARLAIGEPSGDYTPWDRFGEPIITPDARADASAEIDALAILLFGVSEELMAPLFRNQEQRRSAVLSHLNSWQAGGDGA